MRLIWHIIRKDALHLKWVLAGWALSHAVKIGIGFAVIGGVRFERSAFGTIETATFALAAIGGLMTFVITALLVQEDALVGTTPFWITRPISGGRLLASKLLGWFLLLWLPAVLLALPWWLTCGFGPREIVLAALEILAAQVVVALPAALMASLTDTLGRVLIWSFVLLFAGMTIPMMTSWWVGKDLSAIYVLAGWGVFVLTVLAVIACQYFRRGWKRSLVLLGAGVVLAPVVAVVLGKTIKVMPEGLRDWTQGRARWTELNPDRAKDISLSLHSFYALPQKGSADSKDTYVYAHLAAHGVPDGLVVAGYSANQTWRWTNGVELQRDNSWATSWGGEPRVRSFLAVGPQSSDAETERFLSQQRERIEKRQAEDYVRRVRAQSQMRKTIPIGIETTTMVRPSLAERMRTEPPAYEARVQLALLRPEVWYDLPLSTGGWHARGGYGFRLGSDRSAYSATQSRELVDGKYVPDQRPGTALSIVFTVPGFLWESFFYANNWFRLNWRIPTFYVVNRAGGDFQRQYLYLRYPQLTIASVGINRDSLRFATPVVRRGDQWVPRDENWLRDVRLVLVGYEELARFSREVKADRFEGAK